MKVLLALLLLAVSAFGQNWSKEEFRREAGDKPTIEEGDELPRCVLQNLRYGLPDPEGGLRIDRFKGPYEGSTPGGRPCWLVDVTYSATNKFGAMIQKPPLRFYIKNDAVVSTKVDR